MLGESSLSTPRSRRARFPWFPIIKCKQCLRDLECLNFCPAGVFDWDPVTGRPVVARPFDCIPGCRLCVENCKGKSISLPGKKQVAAALERIRAEDGLLFPSGKGKKRARAMPLGPDENRPKRSKHKPGNPESRTLITLTGRERKTT